MIDPAQRHATYDDILDLPENLVGEILGGQLNTHPRPAPRRARAYSALGYSLGARSTAESPAPAAGGSSTSRRSIWAATSSSPTSPAGVASACRRCPIRPGSTSLPIGSARSSRRPQPAPIAPSRLPIYAREGVPHLWLVDPDSRTLEVYRLQDDGHWLLLATLKDDDPVSQPPFDAITFPLATLWA